MKILIEVITPGNGKKYELMLDDKLAVNAAKEKIIEQIQAFENNCIAFGSIDNSLEGVTKYKDVSIFSLSLRKQLPDNCNLRKAGLRGGHTVFLL